MVEVARVAVVVAVADMVEEVRVVVDIILLVVVV